MQDAGGRVMKSLRTLAVVVAAVCLAAGAASVAASDALKAVVGSYLEIQTQLASDKTDGVKASATSLASRAEALGDAGAPVAKAAKAVADAPDLKAAREAFGPLSDAVIAAAKAEGWKDLGDVKLAYCPMVKRSWLQKEEKINNPYYGSAMATCGEFKKP
jgi:Cu(I)/Ag(I) efflux system membrane fusion protein